MDKPTKTNHQSAICLYGPSGSGKSTVGRILAENLNLALIDLDAEVETQAGSSIPEIFAREGESGFRAQERQALETALAGGEAVIALGGGALTQPGNRELVETHGRVVLLSAPVETLLSRLENDEIERPLLSSSRQESRGEAGDIQRNLVDLLAQREGHYASFPSRVATTGKTPAQVAWEVQRQLGIFHLSGMASAKHPGYDVRVQPGGLDQIGYYLKNRKLRGPVIVVTDGNVAPLYLSRVTASLLKSGYETREITIAAGEIHKTLVTVSRLWDAFLSAGIERGSTVVALGGGVVGDLAGFAAATFLRGVSWVAVPTSLLAMVDASMGGKTGADLPLGKNLIGAFYPPRFVLADPEVLESLPKVEFTNGMAEVLKHGVIADPELFTQCCAGSLGVRNPETLNAIVRHAMAVKVAIIEEDPFEKGFRAALNFGHTVGHGVELASNFQIRHGEAVAIGMVAETRLAETIGLAKHGLAVKIGEALNSLGLPTEISSSLDRNAIAAAMKRDKKVAGGAVKFAVPVDIGDVSTGVEIADWEKIIRES